MKHILIVIIIIPNKIQFLIKKVKKGKFPGYDLISNKILQKITKVISGSNNLHFQYHALAFVFSINMETIHNKYILISKQNKPKNLVNSYRQLIYNHLWLSYLKNLYFIEYDLYYKHIILFQILNSDLRPDTRFYTKYINTSFLSEKNQYCPDVFLDVAQAFDRLWHKGLLYKLKQFLTAPYYLIIKFYLENHIFVVR
jgi:hypothetical protein